MLKIFVSESAKDEVDGHSVLDEIAREGARRMLVAALETEVAAYLEAHREERDHPVRRRVRGQVPKGRHNPGEGRRRTAHVLRLSRRALEASPHQQRDRVAVRDGAAPSARDEGRAGSRIKGL